MHKRKEELLKKLFELSNTEIKVIENLEHGCLRIKDLSKILKKDRSTIQKAIYRLIEQEICTKESKCCDGSGGRYFVYCFVGDETLKDISKQKVESYCNECKDMIEEL